MVQFIKNLFRKKKYIRFDFIGQHGLGIDTNFLDHEIRDFIFSIYTHELIGDIMDYLKVNKEDQYDRIVEFLEEQVQLSGEQVEVEDLEKPIIGVLSENNNMGGS